MILFLLLFCCCCCRFFFGFGEFLLFTISHKKVNKPFVVLTGGNVKNTSGVDIKKM